MSVMVRIEGAAAAPAPLFDWNPGASPALPAPARPLPAASNDDAAGAGSWPGLAPLDRAERAAILSARGDGRDSLGASRAGAWLGRLASGARRSARLGGERLEALRRYAILYRLDGALLSGEEEERLSGAGFSAGQAAAIRLMVDSLDDPRPRGKGRTGAVLLLAAVAAAIYFLNSWLARQVDDPLSALVVTIALVTGITSLLAVSAHPKTGAR